VDPAFLEPTLDFFDLHLKRPRLYNLITQVLNYVRGTIREQFALENPLVIQGPAASTTLMPLAIKMMRLEETGAIHRANINIFQK
jgi:hypothetical protein